ncbi:hypothetical protein, partial [Chromobacterium alticapitis]|uniref:hypothetical protein n=1 Tax=Chromobacterium alticapitis TaxID=2073169 RepID=UPI001E56FB66
RSVVRCTSWSSVVSRVRVSASKNQTNLLWALTKETSFPSEWYGSFSDQDEEAYIVLHLEEGRRLMGYPKEWPSTPMEGHFVMIDASWLLDEPDSDSGRAEVRLENVEKFLVDVKKVTYVEFLKY